MAPDLLTLAQRAVTALERIADALEIVVAESAPDETPAPTGCTHPAERRVDFGVTNGAPDWLCQECGHRSVQEHRA